MARWEVLATRYGEMLDMINCLAIYDGRAVPAKRKRHWTFDEAIALR